MIQGTQSGIAQELWMGSGGARVESAFHVANHVVRRFGRFLRLSLGKGCRHRNAETSQEKPVADRMPCGANSHDHLLLFSQIGDGLLDFLGVRRFWIKLQIFLQLVGCFFVLLGTDVDAAEHLVS